MEDPDPSDSIFTPNLSLSPPPTTPSHQIQIQLQTPNPRNPQSSPSPLPNAFNPDDFFASPPNPIPPQRQTPDLKRRLFAPADPLLSGPNTTSRRQSPDPDQYPDTTPLRPATPFPNPLASHPPTPPALPPLSPPPPLLPDTVPAHLDLSRLQAPPPPQPPHIPTQAATTRTKCSCKASRCLKLYCPCFANSSFCTEHCTCKNCQNTHQTSSLVREARQTVLSRDPRAFQPKVRISPATAKGRGDIHAKGCNCRKGCAKNYCVCRELNVACGPRCTCSGPNGCLNGKKDVPENHHFRGKAEQLVPARRPPPAATPRLPAQFPSIRTARRVAQASASETPAPVKFARPKASLERKRANKAAERHMDTSALPDVQDVFSPSFPAFNMTNGVALRDTMDEFRKVIGPQDEDEFITPFSLRSASPTPQRPSQSRRQVLKFQAAGQGGAVALVETPKSHLASGSQGSFVDDGAAPVNTIRHRLRREDNGSGLMPLNMTNEEVLSIKRRLTEYDMRHSSRIRRQALKDTTNKNTEPSEVVTRLPVKRERELGAPVSDSKNLVTPDASLTPKTKKIKVQDIEAASSPTTDGKDSTAQRPWSTLHGSLFSKDEKIEVSRLPRILRLKMASGNLLRKFES